MKGLLKKILPSQVIALFKQYRNLTRKTLYYRQIKKRSKLSVFDYQELAKDMLLWTKEYGNNAFYGNSKAVKNYLGQSDGEIVSGAIEHGIYKEGFISSIDAENHDSNIIYTFSEQRKRFLQQELPGKIIYAIGPYIQYVDYNMSEKCLNNLKQKYGKTLVVFPYHSTHYMKIKNDDTDFIAEIEKIKSCHKYKTVIVCMYWKDILEDKHLVYINQGYTVVTAGHIYDCNFLSRLKSIILLADGTMSNQFGTHIGYCVCLKKPHYLYLQDIKYDLDDNKGNFEDVSGNGNDIKYKECYIDVAKENFGRYSETLTKESVDFVRKYWGEWK